MCVCPFGGRFWIRFLIQKGAVLAGRALVGAHASAPMLDVVPAAGAECEKAAWARIRRQISENFPKSWTNVAVEIRS